MKRLIDRLCKISSSHYGKPINSQKIILTQKELVQNHNTPLPEKFLELLHLYNGISYDGATILGITSASRGFRDITLSNQMSPFKGHPHLVLLGYDELDYLVYNAQNHSYQIIDKEDLEVLEEYSDMVTAILHILKI